MLPILRNSKSDRSLRKLKKGNGNFSWSGKSNKAHQIKPEVDFTAFHSGLPLDPPLQSTTSLRRPRRISIRNLKRDSILIDLTNKDLLPALDYAFAILDADTASTHSLPPPPPKMPFWSRGSSEVSAAVPSTSTSSLSASVRSAPPRYVYVSSPLSSSSPSSSTTSASLKPTVRPTPPPSTTTPFDPHELSRALSSAQSEHDLPSPAVDPPTVPFPLPAAPPAERIPLLQRKPRLLHSAESSMDGHEPFTCRSLPSSSKVSLVRSVSSLDHHRDVFGSRNACYSTTSLHTLDSSLSSLLAGQSAPRAPYGSLKIFSSPKKNRTPARRASTPPPSRARLGIPSARPPVPALPDVFLLGPAARREAVAASSSLLSRSRR